MIATARRFLGLPYLWGGTTPLGIDCSAFVQLAYRLHGVELRRDSDIQFTQPDLEVVERQELDAGDLVFFGADKARVVNDALGALRDRLGHDRRYSVHIDKISALGWQLELDFEHGLEHTVDWYRSNRDWWEPLKMRAGL